MTLKQKTNEVVNILNLNGIPHYISSEHKDVAFVRVVNNRWPKFNMLGLLGSILPMSISRDDVEKMNDESVETYRIRIDK